MSESKLPINWHEAHPESLDLLPLLSFTPFPSFLDSLRPCRVDPRLVCFRLFGVCPMLNHVRILVLRCL
jgi:hypothetical protein